MSNTSSTGSAILMILLLAAAYSLRRSINKYRLEKAAVKRTAPLVADLPTLPKAETQKGTIVFKESEARCNHHDLLVQYTRIALRVIKDETHKKEEVPSYNKDTKRYKYTSVLAIGYHVFLNHPKNGDKHSWVVHSPSGQAYALPVKMAEEMLLDSSWGESELRLVEDSEDTVKRIQKNEIKLLEEAKKLLDEPEKK